MIGHVLIVGFLAVVTMMLVVWVIYLVSDKPAIVDVVWGIGFVVLVSIYGALGEGWVVRTAVVSVMVCLWALRLSWLILKRILRETEEDSRYVQARKDWKENLHFKFFLFYEFQALLQVVIALPILFICLNSSTQFSILEGVGMFIWLIAFVGEVIADEQLKNFKMNTNNKGKVCDVGLWNYSRHPNYFFEWLIWVGFFIFAASSPLGWISVISPALILYLLLNVTGVPLAEAQSLKSRGDAYKEYQRTTSVFIPLPKRK